MNSYLGYAHKLMDITGETVTIFRVCPVEYFSSNRHLPYVYSQKDMFIKDLLFGKLRLFGHLHEESPYCFISYDLSPQDITTHLEKHITFNDSSFITFMNRVLADETLAGFYDPQNE